MAIKLKSSSSSSAIMKLLITIIAMANIIVGQPVLSNNTNINNNFISNHRMTPSSSSSSSSSMMKSSANEPEKTISTNTANNGNVYGADTSSNNGGGGGGSNGGSNNNQQNNPQSVNRGYNQGYSYNTGIKPYRTGYTYFQPFGDAVNQPNNNNGDNNTGNGDAPQVQQLPVELPNFFGIDPKQLGPVRVIQNKNLPLDENGIPILDAIHIPENNNEDVNSNKNAQQQQASPPPPPPPPPVDVPVNANDFNDFNFNNILSGNPQPQQQQQQQQQPRQNVGGLGIGDGMFDFAPPSSNNFNFGRPNNGRATDESDYNRLDDFAGNLNNFDTYLGDPSLMLDNNPSARNNNNGGLQGFGFEGQQVPSEIVNLNNAFGTGANNNNNNRQADNLNDILNQFSGSGVDGPGAGGPQINNNNNNDNGDIGDFGNFGSSTNVDPAKKF